jgi:hypothetical protein
MHKDSNDSVKVDMRGNVKMVKTETRAVIKYLQKKEIHEDIAKLKH